MVEKIEIENFKSIRNQSIELKNLNVLIGQNGAGKSNFISLFQFIERLCDQQLAEYIYQSGGIENFLFGGYEQSKVLKISIELSQYDSVSNIYEFKIYSNGEKYQFDYERIYFWNKSFGNPLEPEYIQRGGMESELKNIINKSSSAGYWSKYLYNFIKDLKVYHFHDTGDNAKSKSPQSIDDIYFLKKEADNVAPFLLFLREKYNFVYNRIIETIRLVYPTFHDFELAESPLAKGKMVLRWREKGNEHIYSVKQISDGTLRFICLATLLLQPSDLPSSPKTILLDEPELGLHPFAIHILAELIKKASLNRQIILSTQSVTLINHFEPEDLIITERNQEGETIFSRKTNKELADWLQDYTLGHLWENNFFGGRP